MKMLETGDPRKRDETLAPRRGEMALLPIKGAVYLQQTVWSSANCSVAEEGAVTLQEDDASDA